MAKWLDDKAEKFEQIDARREQEERVRVHKAEIVKAIGPAWWDRFRRFIESEISSYNDKVRATPARQLKFLEIRGGGKTAFEVENNVSPRVVLSASFDGYVVTCFYRTSNEGLGTTTEKTLCLSLWIDHDNSTPILQDWGRVLSEDDVLAILLERLLSPTD